MLDAVQTLVGSVALVIAAMTLAILQRQERRYEKERPRLIFTVRPVTSVALDGELWHVLELTNEGTATASSVMVWANVDAVLDEVRDPGTLSALRIELGSPPRVFHGGQRFRFAVQARDLGSVAVLVRSTNITHRQQFVSWEPATQDGLAWEVFREQFPDWDDFRSRRRRARDWFRRKVLRRKRKLKPVGPFIDGSCAEVLGWYRSDDSFNLVMGDHRATVDPRVPDWNECRAL